MVNDISRAFSIQRQSETCTCNWPPRIHYQVKTECGKLRYSMSGTRDAAQNWYKECSGRFVEMGFTQGRASPCALHIKQRAIRPYVHGGDNVSLGLPHQLKWMKEELERRYIVKTQFLGPEYHHQQELEILNRMVQWNGTTGIVYEANPRPQKS